MVELIRCIKLKEGFWSQILYAVFLNLVDPFPVAWYSIECSVNQLTTTHGTKVAQHMGRNLITEVMIVNSAKHRLKTYIDHEGLLWRSSSRNYMWK